MNQNTAVFSIIVILLWYIVTCIYLEDKDRGIECCSFVRRASTFFDGGLMNSRSKIQQ